MGYCIHYIFVDDAPPALAELTRRIAGVSDLSLSRDGEVRAGTRLIGQGELVHVADPGASEDIQTLLEELDVLEAEDDADIDAVSSHLWNATGIFRVQVLWEGEDPHESLRALNALWPELLGHYSGLLYAEQEGYYDSSGLLLDLG